MSRAELIASQQCAYISAHLRTRYTQMCSVYERWGRGVDDPECFLWDQDN
jgi:hypothetical protein